MKLARYVGQGRIEIRDEPEPTLPPGGLIVKTQASGLCSGELMDWYMERKVPHVLGHEVAGVVVESDDSRFPVGSKVAPHHHAACGFCSMCQSGRAVHCEQWKRTKLIPGGMAEYFAVSEENLSDTHKVGKLRPQDAALLEPLGCVAKSVASLGEKDQAVAVIGLGSMGLMHLLALRDRSNGIDLNPARREWAESLGLNTFGPEHEGQYEGVIACPGGQSALDAAFRLAQPCATIVLFAPFPPGSIHNPQATIHIPWDRLYFEEISLVPSYSCGPKETARALNWLKQSVVKAEQVVSHFIGIDELPQAYEAMKKGEILKAMVMFE